MEKPKSAEVVAFWEEFRRARGVPQQPFDACRFADDAALNDELLALALCGFNRATACLLRDVEAGNDMMARVGGMWSCSTGATGRKRSGGRALST